jgi:hypothetical protein
LNLSDAERGVISLFSYAGGRGKNGKRIGNDPDPGGRWKKHSRNADDRHPTLEAVKCTPNKEAAGAAGVAKALAGLRCTCLSEPPAIESDRRNGRR